MIVSNNNVFLIDSENVSVDFIHGVFNRNKNDSTIVIFYTDSSISKIKSLNPMSYTVVGGNMNIEFRHCCVGTNSLDFNLVAYLGSLVETMRRGTIYIVSNDKGFDTVIHEFSNVSASVKRLSEFHGLIEFHKGNVVQNNEITTLKTKKSKFADRCMRKIMQDLSERGITLEVIPKIAQIMYDTLVLKVYKLNCAEIKDVYVNEDTVTVVHNAYESELRKIKSLFNYYIYTGELNERGTTKREHDIFVRNQLLSCQATIVKVLKKYSVDDKVANNLSSYLIERLKKGNSPQKNEIKIRISSNLVTITNGKLQKLTTRMHSALRGLYNNMYNDDIFVWLRDEDIEIKWGGSGAPKVESVVDVKVEEVADVKVDTKVDTKVKEVKVEEVAEKEDEYTNQNESLVKFADLLSKELGFSRSKTVNDMKMFLNKGNFTAINELLRGKRIRSTSRDVIMDSIIDVLWSDYTLEKRDFNKKSIDGLLKYCKRYSSSVNSKKLCLRIADCVGKNFFVIELYYKLLKKYGLKQIKDVSNKSLSLENWREGLIFIEC